MKKNNLYFGVLLGSIAPFMAFILTNFSSLTIQTGDKKLSFYIIAALINLLLVRYYYRNDLSDSARGVVLITFIGTMVAVFLGNMNIGG